ILGAKGSGKTHLMRYYSFHLQKLRNVQNLIEGIYNEGFIGIYTLCSGLNPYRFCGKNISEDRWKSVFAYYFELWLAQITLGVLKEISEHTSEGIFNKANIYKRIVDLFDFRTNVKLETFQDIINFINDLRKSVDMAVNNAFIPGKLDALDIKVTTGKLIFGIPKVIVSEIDKFRKIKFLYLIDEFENISKDQQIHVNTLLREKEAPSTFKIGVRLYGMKTYLTYSGDEENKEGSEFEKLILDKYLREYDYKKFFRGMCEKRILYNKEVYEKDSSNVKLEKYFEEFTNQDIVENIKQKYHDKEKPYFHKLEKKLENARCTDIKTVIDLLKYHEDPLLERTNIFLFYRGWKKKDRDFLAIATEIKRSLDKYLKDPKFDTLHNRVLEKFRSDIISQMQDECGEDIHYSGFDELLEISHGIPRVLIVLLKNITKWSSFKGEKPFCENSKISARAQINGLKETSEWFWEDARLPGPEGEVVKKCILRIALLLREIRYSDLPPECSLTAFTFDETKLSAEASANIDLAEKFSYLIKVGERRDKNSKKINPIYQINRILAPKWDLPIAKRGELSLDPREVNTIFSDSAEDTYKDIIKQRKLKYNAPFEIQQSNEVVGLFNE
ncbi:MAG: hypothetical protein A2V66_06055, partial [Ignavibacteria bacterium RBG_13_36_8]